MPELLNFQGTDPIRGMGSFSKDKEFRSGAELCLKKALEEKVDMVILQSRSPACGAKQVYDGSFSGKLIEGRGVFAQLLGDNGIKVLDLEDLYK